MNLWRILRFLALGGFAAFVNLTARWLLTPFIGFEWSVLVAYGAGMVIAYLLFRQFVFQPSGKSVLAESGRFIAVNFVAVALVWGVSVLLARLVFPAVGFDWYPEDVAHFIGVAVPALSSYIGHSRYTFKERNL